MADVTYSSWCSRAWKPKGSSTTRQYRARLDTTLYTYDTYCAIYCTLYLELTHSVSHNNYHWGASNGGTGTVNSAFEGATTIGCYSWWTGNVGRGHTAGSISASGYIYASSSGGSNTWNNQTVTATASYTVPALDSWSVTYNVNGGEGTISNSIKWYGENLTLSDGTGFTRANYNLVGWNTAADGSGTHYDLGETYSGNAALALYAEWVLNAITLKTKINDTWVDGTLYMKINGNWEIPHIGYIKVNNEWKQIVT